MVEEVSPEIVSNCVRLWRDHEDFGLAPGTINCRLHTLRAIGVNVEGCWVKNKLPPKWWLRDETREALLLHLRNPEGEPFAPAKLLADYVEFVSYTGLRVEEALRLEWGMITLFVHKDGEGMMRSSSELTVPGTKTRSSQASIALALLPSLLLLRMQDECDPDSSENRVFPISYEVLHLAWNKARNHIGAGTNRLATLRALRRTAARHLTVNGMPTDMVKQYLRHTDIKTTMGYLRLVGGYNTQEQRRWL